MANDHWAVSGRYVDERRMPSIDIILEALHVDSFPWHVSTFTRWRSDPYGHRLHSPDQTPKTQLECSDAYMPSPDPKSMTNPVAGVYLSPVNSSRTTRHPSTQTRRLPFTCRAPQEQMKILCDAASHAPSNSVQSRPVQSSSISYQTAQSLQPTSSPATGPMAKRDRARVWYGSDLPVQEPHKLLPAVQGVIRHAQSGVQANLEPPTKKARRTTSSEPQEAHRLATETSLSGTADRVQGDQDQQATRQPADARGTRCKIGIEATPPLFLVRAPGSTIPPLSPVRIAYADPTHQSSTRPRPVASQLHSRCICKSLLQLEPGMESSPVMMIGLPLGGMIEQAHVYRDDAVTRKDL